MNIVLLQQWNVKLLGWEDVSGEASFMFSTIKTITFFPVYNDSKCTCIKEKKYIAQN